MRILIYICLLTILIGIGAHAQEYLKKSGSCDKNTPMFKDYKELSKKENKSLSEKHTLWLMNEACRIFYLELQFIDNKHPEYCQKGEDVIHCFFRVGKEMREKAPLSVAGLTFRLQTGMKLILKQKKIEAKKAIHKPDVKMQVIVKAALDIVELSLNDLVDCDYRMTPYKIFPNVRPVPLHEIPVEVRKAFEESKEIDKLHEKYPITKKEGFELTILQMVDKDAAARLIKTTRTKMNELLDSMRKKMLTVKKEALNEEAKAYYLRNRDRIDLLIKLTSMVTDK